ncbi:HNH endonuclease [Gordonia phage LitninMcQueen]
MTTADLVPFSDLVDKWLDFHSRPPERYPVIRTRHTEDRIEIPKHIRIAVLMRDEFTCRLCWKTGGRMEIDHIIPWSAGGSDDPTNLRACCFPCNQARSNFITFVDQPRPLITAECAYCNNDLVCTGPVFCLTCRYMGVGEAA